MSKTVAIHQPNFFPWMGYFYKIVNCDIFVFHDDTLLSQKDVTRRVRFNSSDGSWWATVQLDKKEKTSDIKDVIISGDNHWRVKLEKRITHTYEKAPYFDELSTVFKECINYSTHHLSEFNIFGVKQIANLLKVQPFFVRSSDLSLNSTSTQKEIDTLKALGADTYLSGKGAVAYQQDALFNEAGLKLIYSEFKEEHFRQVHGSFVGGLSIWDVLFNIGVEKTRKLLKSNE